MFLILLMSVVSVIVSHSQLSQTNPHVPDVARDLRKVEIEVDLSSAGCCDQVEFHVRYVRLRLATSRGGGWYYPKARAWIEEVRTVRRGVDSLLT